MGRTPKPVFTEDHHCSMDLNGLKGCFPFCHVFHTGPRDLFRFASIRVGSLEDLDLPLEFPENVRWVHEQVLRTFGKFGNGKAFLIQATRQSSPAHISLLFGSDMI